MFGVRSGEIPNGKGGTAPYGERHGPNRAPPPSPRPRRRARSGPPARLRRPGERRTWRLGVGQAERLREGDEEAPRRQVPAEERPAAGPARQGLEGDRRQGAQGREEGRAGEARGVPGPGEAWGAVLGFADALALPGPRFRPPAAAGSSSAHGTHELRPDREGAQGGQDRRGDSPAVPRVRGVR
jgi:hypothetical protein